jgi:hypothetical protein
MTALAMRTSWPYRPAGSATRSANKPAHGERYQRQYVQILDDLVALNRCHCYHLSRPERNRDNVDKLQHQHEGDGERQIGAP